MKKPYSKYTKQEFDILMDKKHNKLIKKHPSWNAQYLFELHKLIDWYYDKVSKIN